MAKLTHKSLIQSWSATMKLTFKLFLSVFILTCSSLLWAGEMKLEEDGFMVDLGRIPKNMKALAGAFPRKSQADPVILVFQNGYKSFGAPDSVTLSCWEPYDSFYDHPEPVYFGVVLGNFETTTKNVQLLWELAGTKSLKVRQTKNIPGLRVVAYFVKKPLAATSGAYGLRTSVFYQGRMIHALATYFFIADVF
jgi:hypothetical protein